MDAIEAKKKAANARRRASADRKKRAADAVKREKEKLEGTKEACRPGGCYYKGAHKEIQDSTNTGGNSCSYAVGARDGDREHIAVVTDALRAALESEGFTVKIGDVNRKYHYPSNDPDMPGDGREFYTSECFLEISW